MKFYFTINSKKYSYKSVQAMRKGIEHFQAKGVKVDQHSVGLIR